MVFQNYSCHPTITKVPLSLVLQISKQVSVRRLSSFQRSPQMGIYLVLTGLHCLLPSIILNRTPRVSWENVSTIPKGLWPILCRYSPHTASLLFTVSLHVQNWYTGQKTSQVREADMKTNMASGTSHTALHEETYGSATTHSRPSFAPVIK